MLSDAQRGVLTPEEEYAALTYGLHARTMAASLADSRLSEQRLQARVAELTWAADQLVYYHNHGMIELQPHDADRLDAALAAEPGEVAK